MMKEEERPSIWKQYGPAIAMGSCCAAPALIAAGAGLLSTMGLGAGTGWLVGAVLVGGGLYLLTRKKAQHDRSGSSCCPTPEPTALPSADESGTASARAEKEKTP